MVDISRHWIVCAFTPDLTGETLGTLGAVVNADNLLATEADAHALAQEMAAQNPGHYYVIYRAEHFAHTVFTPVVIERVKI